MITCSLGSGIVDAPIEIISNHLVDCGTRSIKMKFAMVGVSSKVFDASFPEPPYKSLKWLPK